MSVVLAAGRAQTGSSCWRQAHRERRWSGLGWRSRNPAGSLLAMVRRGGIEIVVVEVSVVHLQVIRKVTRRGYQ
jgi:hypothetical protein